MSPDPEAESVGFAPRVACELVRAAQRGRREAGSRHEAACIVEHVGAAATLSIVPREESPAARGQVNSVDYRLVPEHIWLGIVHHPNANRANRGLINQVSGGRKSWARMLGFILALELAALHTPEILSADLKPQTLEAFAHYVQLTEARMQREPARPDAFLYIEQSVEPGHSQVLASLRHGEVYMVRLKTRDASGHEVAAPDAIIHHWMGVVFVPRVTLKQTLDLVEDYDQHQNIYKPEVVRSRLISQDGNDFKIYYRLRKKKIITITLNTDHNVRYFPIDATHCRSRSYSMRIAEVADADTSQEREKPVRHDGGFLWRLYSYWRFEEKDGGIYIECESVSLTRDVPTLLKPLINPFITGIPKESLQMTMGSTRSALLARYSPRQKPPSD